MKSIGLIFLPVLPLLLIANEIKQAKKESRDFTKGQMGDLQDILLQKGQSLEFTDQDLLPDSDKGKTFDGEKALSQSKNPNASNSGTELQAFHKSLPKGEEFEGTEALFAQGSAILKAPSSALGDLNVNSQNVPEEEQLITCFETGTFQATISQKRKVTFTPEVKQQVKSCKGHTKKKTFASKSFAEQKLASKKAKLTKDSTIASVQGVVEQKGSYFTGYTYERTMTWKHHDNTPGCNAFFMRDEVVEAAKEEDSWEPVDSEGLEHLEKSPHCKLLQAQMIPSPETKTIQNRPVFRDSWMRELLFSCEPDSDSPCAKLRNQGGVLMSKNCQEENPLGECDLWKKTYDLGKLAAYQQSALSIDKTPLWENDDSLDFHPKKSTDFGSSVTTLSFFAELEHQMEENGTDFQEHNIKLFKGDKLKCQRTFLGGSIFDCCSKMKGLANKAKLAACNTDEKRLAENRDQGKCRHVGSHKEKLGTVTTQVFCCFPTKLARVIHEQGRKQLGIKWGTSEKPKCRGFTLYELQRLDFTKIDLTEVVDDLQIRREELAQKLQAASQQLQTKIQSEIEQKKPAPLMPVSEGGSLDKQP